MTVVEMFSLAVARHAGLRTPDAQYWQAPDGDLRALVVERYDRHLGTDGLVHRDHQEDLCQALAIPPEKKYQHLFGGPGVGSVGELIRLRVPAQNRLAIARDFLALVTLNIAMVNTDAHAKNYSLMLRGDAVALAPAYDVLSIALYTDRDEPGIRWPSRCGSATASTSAASSRRASPPKERASGCRSTSRARSSTTCSPACRKLSRRLDRTSPTSRAGVLSPTRSSGTCA